MASPLTIKLGTRKSLLAMTQSSLVADELVAANPGLSVELVGIETKGDRITDVPLSQIEGKEFFVKEIDDALMKGDVDFTVHSYKDLSTERPPAICTGAIPERFNPRDIIVFHDRVLDRLKAGETIAIGTSSPRRIENIPPFLRDALPQFGRRPDLKFVEIRGNVNTRLERLHAEGNSGRQLEAVVLAFAGLARLMRHPESAKSLLGLLGSTRLMVMPLDECPTAPAQGALALECRADDHKIQQILATIHHPPSERAVQAERGLMAEWGGGCHQKFGITARDYPSLGQVLFQRGLKANGERVDATGWQPSPSYRQLPRSEGDGRWDGCMLRSEVSSLDVLSLPPAEAVFVASAKAAAGDSVKAYLNNKRIWVSGTASWKALARQGHWVEGCAEGFGFESIKETLEDKLLNLPKLAKWVVLTHAGATDTWAECQVVGTYQVDDYDLSRDEQQALGRATYVFWSSFTQYQKLRGLVSNNAVHAAGPGKTFELMKQAGVKVQAFPSRQSWLDWLDRQTLGI